MQFAEPPFRIDRFRSRFGWAFSTTSGAFLGSAEISPRPDVAMFSGSTFPGGSEEAFWLKGIGWPAVVGWLTGASWLTGAGWFGAAGWSAGTTWTVAAVVCSVDVRFAVG
jgi:hypothetical protein